MESIVDDVEDEGETEGSPANPESCVDSGGCEVMRMSISVHHSDGLSRFDHCQGCNRQAVDNFIIMKYKTENTT